MQDCYIDTTEAPSFSEGERDTTAGISCRPSRGFAARWAARLVAVPPAPDGMAGHRWAEDRAYEWATWLNALHMHAQDTPAAIQLRLRQAEFGLHISVMGMVVAPDPSAAQALARDHSQIALALFPTRYGLSPATDAESFAAIACDDWLSGQPAMRLMGIRRSSWVREVDPANQEWGQTIDPAPWSLSGLTNTCRALYHQRGMAMVTITASPTMLSPDEEQWVVHNYDATLARWRRPWRVAVQAAGTITPLVRAALVADYAPVADLCTPSWTPAASTVEPLTPTPEEVPAALAAMQYGQIVPWGPAVSMDSCGRLRMLDDVRSVTLGLRIPPLTADLLAIFRVPLPTTYQRPMLEDTTHV